MFLNKVQIIGNLTKDPELKSLPTGVNVCSFSVATNEFFVKDGVKKEKVEYHNIVCFGKTAENVSKYMKKGSQIYLEGKLQTRSWESEGKKVYRTEVLADSIQFGNNRNSSSTSSSKKEEVDEDITGGYEGELATEDGDIPF